MTEDYFVYIACQKIGNKIPEQCKIGITNNTKRRLTHLQSASPYKLTYYHLFLLPNKDAARSVESCVLSTNKCDRMNGEWLSISPRIVTEKAALTILVMLKVSGLDGDSLYKMAETMCAWNLSGPLEPNLGCITHQIHAETVHEN